jgi:drug/metabolite transporter (DMT)-like permease
MIIGILLVLAACFVWGLIFVIPELLLTFTPLEVALGRYAFLGIFSLIFMLFQGWQKWRHFSIDIWKTAVWYALIINIFYYFFLITGLRYSNPSVMALLLGISPITISFYGSWRQKDCPFRQLILPSSLIVCGLILVNFSALVDESVYSISQYLFGLLCGLLSLIAWNWYVIANAEFLRRRSDLLPSDWANLIGVGTLFWVILIGGAIALLTSFDYLQRFWIWNEELRLFLIGTFILGFFCSWLGSYLWNQGTKSLPISLAGQLTIFETIFGLLFVYLFEQRWPSGLETLGIIAILGGVSYTVNVFRKAKTTSASASTLLTNV